MARPKVLILHATGTNRDREAALACQEAGGAPEIVHVNQLRERSRSLLDYAMLVLPGGFSYGDALGAGKLWAVDLRFALGDDLARFVESGRPVLGICNGFQALVKSGYLPEPPNGNTLATLAGAGPWEPVHLHQGFGRADHLPGRSRGGTVPDRQ